MSPAIEHAAQLLNMCITFHLAEKNPAQEPAYVKQGEILYNMAEQVMRKFR